MKRISIQFSVFIILVTGLFLPGSVCFGQYGGTTQPPPSSPSYYGNLDYRMVNLTSPWNFMNTEWEGYSQKATNPASDSGDTLFPYVYWDYEKQYLLAQVRILEKRGVNSIRILLMRPFEICEWSIKNLSNSDVRKHWWSQDYTGWRGTVYQDISTEDFQDPDYMASHWGTSPNDISNYQNIDRCWDRLMEFLVDMKINFPNVHVVLSFTLGGEIMGALPVEKTFFEGDPKEFDQIFDNYYTGTNWLYFKTFYDKCMEKIEEINDDEENFPGIDLDDVNDFLTFLNVDFTEINNEYDGSCKKYDVDSYYLYARPDDRYAIPEFYYDTNAQLAASPESTYKRSREMFRQTIDRANDLLTYPGYFGIDDSKVTYGFTHAETMRLLALERDLQNSSDDSYIYSTLSWHMYGDLFSIGLGPKVDWVRKSMNYFTEKDYQILLGEFGHFFDYELSNSDTPYEPFNEPNPGVYTAYDLASNCGQYYTQQWLKEAEHFSESAYENIWGPVATPVAPLIGAGVWSSSDTYLITPCGSHVWRWGLLEAFDTPYRKPENWEPSGYFNHLERTKRKIVAPIGRYALQSVEECWSKTYTDPFPSTWHSGDLVNLPFYISCGVNDTLSKTVNLNGYTFSYGGSENPPTAPSCKPSPFTYGADIWFRTKYFHNIYDELCYRWKVECGTSGVQKIAAIYYRNSTSNEWTLGDCSYSNSPSTPAIAEYCVPENCTENLSILFYLWTSTADCAPTFSLSVNYFPDPKQ